MTDRKAIMLIVAIVSLNTFGELAWPSDFDEKVAARIAESGNANATVVSADTAAYDTISGFHALLDGIGSEEQPFDSRLCTFGFAWNKWLLTKPPIGFAITVR